MMSRTPSSSFATQVLLRGHGRLTKSTRISPKLLGNHKHCLLSGNLSEGQHYDHHRHHSSDSSRNFSTTNLPSCLPSYSIPLSRDDDDDGTGRHRRHVMVHHNSTKKRFYHVTPPSERAVAIVLGLATVSTVAYAASSAISSYREWQAAQPTEEELENIRAQEEKDRVKQEAQRQTSQETEQQQQQQKATTDGPRQNVFRQWFDVGSKYYDGGFEDTMTKREAALILGVRESSSPQRIKDAHRKLLILNHPDTGGSTYLSGKVNEAKELLLKGKQRL
jgi:DnaJ family protein C protein 19